MKYWTVAQIPNLIIAAPVLIPSLTGSFHYLRGLFRLTSKDPRLRVYPALLPFHIHSLHQTLLLIFSAHTQVALRVAISNPVIWWNVAELSFDWDGKAPRKTFWGKAWLSWALVWAAVGIVLWAGHYPPA
jgi:phosphatidylinositol glycan class V